MQFNPFKSKPGPITLKENPKNTAPAVSLPVAGGRQSQAPVSLLGALNEIFAEIKPEFNLELIDFIVNLAMFNSDVSYAVNNVQQLGNTPFEIHFGDKVPEELAKEMATLCKAGFENLYTGGLNSVINDGLAQVAITGAWSYEIVPNRALTDVDQVIQVKTGTIRFLYNPVTERQEPYQKITMGLLDAAVINIHGNLVKLNPVTYKYYPLTRMGEKPYGIPPFLSALESVMIERTMIDSLKSITKKLGILGFMSILLTPPKRLMEQGETDTQYAVRCAQYLQTVRPEAEKGFSSGLSLGFKNVHEFKMENTSMNVEGAVELFKLVSEFKMAGLKQDPLMLGRNFNIAETMAKVILSKLSTQIANYQKVTASFLVDVFRMRLNLQGYLMTDNMQVVFEQPNVSDKLKDHQAEGIKIDNADKKYKQGVITQQQRAQELGYEEPAEEEPLEPVVPEGTLVNPQPDTGAVPSKAPAKAKTKPKTKAKNSVYLSKEQIEEVIMMPQNAEDHHIVDITLADGRVLEDVEIYNYSRVRSEVAFDPAMIVSMEQMTAESWELRLSRACPQFDYHSTCEHGVAHSFDLAHFEKEDKIIKYLASYANATRKVYKGAIDKIIPKIAAELTKFSDGVDLQQVQDKVLSVLYKNWAVDFSQPQKAVINKWVEVAYRSYRKDQSIFTGDAAKVPEATFGVKDIRTMEYFKNNDQLYLGKFITDEDTKKKITEFIKEQYFDKGLPVGNNKDVLDSFKSAFTGVLDGEDWKIVRVLSTTTNKMRAYASLNYINQAEVTKFTIAGVIDSKQCPYCFSMQGRTFTVATALSKMDSVISSSPEYVKSVSPFATSVFSGQDGLDELNSLDDAAVQARGIDTPPYHCSCRDRIVADI